MYVRVKVGDIIMIIDNEIFGNYSFCKYKGFLKYYRKVGIISEYEELQRQRGIKFKIKATMEFIKNCDQNTYIKEKFVNNVDLKSGKELLLSSFLI